MGRHRRRPLSGKLSCQSHSLRKTRYHDLLLQNLRNFLILLTPLILLQNLLILPLILLQNLLQNLRFLRFLLTLQILILRITMANIPAKPTGF